MNNWPSWLPLREDLKSLSPYGAPQISDVIALNTNENPYTLPKDVVSEILKRLPRVLEDLNRYPDRDATQLRITIAQYINSLSDLNFGLENIWAANGSNEILQTLVLACGSGGALGFTPSYSMHPLIAKVCGVKWTDGVRNSDFSLDINSALNQISEIKPTLVFITTPNNPTGNILGLSEIEELAKAAAKIGALLVVDEAYGEFSNEESAVHLIKRYPNVVVVRTMSKAFSLAGARLGYLIADPKIVEAALITRLPYHLSSQTQAIATVALEHFQSLQREVELLVSERNRVTKELESLGMNVIKSEANFLLFTGFKGEAKEVWNSLLNEKILIREVGIPHYLRVTVGTPNQNNQFLAAIALHRP